MKSILVLLTSLSILITNAIFAQASVDSTEGTTITVTVPVQSEQGKVIFGLYTEANFNKQPLAGLTSAIKDGKATVTFTNVTPGTYAVMCFHDRNNDNQMNFQANGMPLEDYGTSNNVMSYGPPQWSDAKFAVGKEPIQMEIRF